MNQTEKRKKRTEIADEQCRSSQKRQHHILLHLHIIRNLPIQNPSPLAHQPQQPYQLHLLPNKKNKTHRPLCKLGQRRLWQFVFSDPHAVRFHLDTGRCRRRISGRFGRVDGRPFGGHLHGRGGGGCFEAGKLRKGDVTQRKIQVLR